MISVRDNLLRTLEFRYPEWIPCSVGFAPVTWNAFRKDLEDIILAHPRIFPDYRQGDSSFFDEMPVVYREGETFRDNWGCLWKNIQGGLEGQVVEHPLADWSALETYRPPDVETKTERGDRDWDVERRNIEGLREQGRTTSGGGERLFDRLYFLRGFQNLMEDIASDDPHLPRLVDLLEEYETELVGKWLAIGVDLMGFHTDIGAQTALMISPAKFRQYIKPMFYRLFQMCRKAGTHVCLSSDGCLLEIVDDLIECGVSLHDPQVRANTIEGIRKAYKGKMCVNVDLDRQGFPFLSPQQIRDDIRRVVDEMAAPEGGLMMQAGVWGKDVPMRNIEAICEGMEDNCFP